MSGKIFRKYVKYCEECKHPVKKYWTDREGVWRCIHCDGLVINKELIK